MGHITIIYFLWPIYHTVSPLSPLSACQLSLNVYISICLQPCFTRSTHEATVKPYKSAMFHNQALVQMRAEHFFIFHKFIIGICTNKTPNRWGQHLQNSPKLQCISLHFYILNSHFSFHNVTFRCYCSF